MTVDSAIVVAAIGTLGGILGAAIRMVYTDQRKTIDRLVAVVEGMVPTLKQLADAQVEANRDAAERHRKGDA